MGMNGDSAGLLSTAVPVWSLLMPAIVYYEAGIFWLGGVRQNILVVWRGLWWSVRCSQCCVVAAARPRENACFHDPERPSNEGGLARVAQSSLDPETECLAPILRSSTH